MGRARRLSGTARLLGLVMVLVCVIRLPAAAEERSAAELDEHRLRGKAYYENDEYAEAEGEFRKCIALAPESAVDYFNLGLVLMRAQRYEEALQQLSKAQEHDPDLVAAHFILGIIYKRQGTYDQAVESLKKVVAVDPECQGAYYNLGVCYKGLQQYDEAIEAFKKKEHLSPDDPSTHYQLISLYRRLGDVENAERHKEIFARVKDTVDEAEKTAEALERSEYSFIIDAPRLREDLKPRLNARVSFVDVSVPSGLEGPGRLGRPDGSKVGFETGSVLTPEELRNRYIPAEGGAVCVADYDGDGDLDIYLVACAAAPEASANVLLQNNGSAFFRDVTEAAGVGDPGMGMDAIFGDYDNDGFTDLYVVNIGPNVLYRNKGDGTFEDVSEHARADEPSFGRTALLFDYDHDDDLDLFIANDADLDSLDRSITITSEFPQDLGGQPNTLLRNRGNGTFTPYTDAAGLLVTIDQTRDAIYGDFDADCDTDLFLVNADGASQFFENARLGTFKVGGAFSPQIPPGATATAQGDFNHDGHGDLIIGGDEKLFLYTNDGSASFTGTAIPLPGWMADTTIRRIVVCEVNNDGWSDLLLLAAGGGPLCMLAGAGPGTFSDATAAVGLDGSFGEVADLAAGDLDADGDEDIVLQTRDRGPVLLRNDSEEPRHWLHVDLVGKKVNRSGYGATVEIASGGHYQRQTYDRTGVHFGLGDLDHVDIVRVTWSDGVAQNVIGPEIDGPLTIEEHVKVSASCAFLYACAGTGFELINEILGIGPLGVPMAPDVYHQPDCTELTKIAGYQLAVKNGFYELRLTEELREIAYADQVALRVVDHPDGLEVIPNEKFVAPPFPEDRLFAVTDHRVPLSASDENGTDVLDLIRERDGRFPTFPLTEYDGLAEPHSLTLDLGDLSDAEEILLFLDGWIYWAESSTVMAIAQDPRYEMNPLTLEVRDEKGSWHPVIPSVGLPTSKGLVVPVDLTGRFLCDDFHIRCSTNLCVYFDRIFVSTHDEADRCRVTELVVDRADLHYRGFSQMGRDALGFERFDYDHVTPTGPWNPPDGFYTRYGDVTELLARPDDQYVIIGPGDELSMLFDATSLPKLAGGWTRDYVFYANGWVKDGDLNTKFSETVTPLPFHAMSRYPYPESESYPETIDHERYRRTYNTRPGGSTVGPLATGR